MRRRVSHDVEKHICVNATGVNIFRECFIQMDGSLHLHRQREGGSGVLVLCGLLKGDIRTMRDTVDRVLADAEDLETLECLVLTWFPSFRIPDGVLRYCFAHVKRYANRLGTIHFVDLPVWKHTVFQSVCRTALPETLRRRVRLSSRGDVATMLGDEILRAIEHLTSEDAEASSVREEDDVVPHLVFHGKKYGGGGEWGSTRSKSKVFYVSRAHVWYADARDARLVSPKMPLSECQVREMHDDILLFSCNDRILRITASSEDLSTFAEVVGGGVASKTKDEL